MSKSEPKPMVAMLTKDEQEELKDEPRCPRCGHLEVFHHWSDGITECRVGSCTCLQ